MSRTGFSGFLKSNMQKTDSYKAQESFLTILKPGLDKLSKGSKYRSATQFDRAGAEVLVDQENGDAEAPMQLFAQITFEDVKAREFIDQKMGFYRLIEGEPRLGWLVNLHDVSLHHVILKTCNNLIKLSI